MQHLKRDESGTWQFGPYFEYLASVRERFPPHVYAFASDWAHYALDGQSTLHDAWLEELVVTEPSTGVRSENRETVLILRFLGPMHDRIQILRYLGVKRYRLEAGSVASGHGDLLVHEVRINRAGDIVHELFFANGAEMIVECADITYEEHPRRVTPPGTAQPR